MDAQQIAGVVHELSILVDRYGVDAVKRGCAFLLSPDYDPRQPLNVVSLYTGVPRGDLLASVVLEPTPVGLAPWEDQRLRTPEPLNFRTDHPSPAKPEPRHVPLKQEPQKPEEQDCDL